VSRPRYVALLRTITNVSMKPVTSAEEPRASPSTRCRNRRQTSGGTPEMQLRRRLDALRPLLLSSSDAHAGTRSGPSRLMTNPLDLGSALTTQEPLRSCGL
jgi:hypothetical protein